MPAFLVVTITSLVAFPVNLNDPFCTGFSVAVDFFVALLFNELISAIVERPNKRVNVRRRRLFITIGRVVCTGAATGTICCLTSRPVQRYVSDFEKRWNQHTRPAGDSWRVDETYIKIKGQWVYLYRAVDKAARTVDFLLRQRITSVVSTSNSYLYIE
jgi:hypothetical protein